MTATEQFIASLTRLKAGELGLLRTHAGKTLDETVNGFDLFAGVWWPLRQKSQRAPRRKVAWLIAKFYASYPVSQSSGETLARQLQRYTPNDDRERKRFAQRLDRMLVLTTEEIEPALQWAIGIIASNNGKLDWVKLTDDLSVWERETTRLKWATEYLETRERRKSC